MSKQAITSLIPTPTGHVSARAHTQSARWNMMRRSLPSLRRRATVLTRRCTLFFSPSPVRDAPRRQRREVSLLRVVIIIQPGERKSSSSKHTDTHKHNCHITHRRWVSEWHKRLNLHPNMRPGLWLPLLCLARSCWCAPQQTCGPEDEVFGKAVLPMCADVSGSWTRAECGVTH